MTSAEDPKSSEGEPPPFWRQIGVSGLMAMAVPIALYGCVFSLAREFNLKQREWDTRPPHFNLGMASELMLLLLSGVLIAIYRRATMREAVIQWSVPPALLIVLGTLVLARDTEWSLGFGLVMIPVCFGTFCAWIHVERGRKRIPWPRNWILSSVLVGLANVGLILLTMAPLGCCLPGTGILVQARA